MRTIGFLISDKKNEKRRALIPKHLENINNKKNILIEKGYGETLGYSDLDYTQSGATVLDRSEVMKADIICDPKIGDSKYIDKIENNKIIYGWIHAVKNKELTDLLISKKLTVIAWEDMYEHGIHLFSENNYIAGQASVLHALNFLGKIIDGLNIAIIGNGNTAKGALNILKKFDITYKIYDRKNSDKLRFEINDYDIIVNAVLWDVDRKDHLIYKDDLLKMKKGSMIIDISCDKSGAIESSHPTKLDDPVYTYNDVIHYVVDHTPTLLYKTVSESLSNIISRYADELIDNRDVFLQEVFKNSLIIHDGKIIDSKINIYQNR